MDYLVYWKIDIDADSPREAAERALEIQRLPDGTAAVFTVRDQAGQSIEVDLDEDPDKAAGAAPPNQTGPSVDRPTQGENQ